MEFLLFFTIFGISLVCVGVYKIVLYKIKLKKYMRVDGIIENYIEERVPRKGIKYTIYRPSISYFANGTKYTIFTNKRKLSVSSVEELKAKVFSVYYDENNPNCAIVEGDDNGIVYIIVGFLYLVIPGFYLLYKLTGQI